MMPTLSELRPRRKWTQIPFPSIAADNTLGRSAWSWRGMVLLSTLVVAEYPDGDGEGLQYHASLSSGGRRPTNKECKIAMKMLGLAEPEEDNHHPGIARHFWMPLDPTRRAACECKASELVITEPDGYQWTTPRNGPCRGCAYARATRGLPTWRQCPLHGDSHL